MRRRNFITLLGGAAVELPLTTWARQSGKLPTIGYLSPSVFSQWTNAFADRCCVIPDKPLAIADEVIE
jgi:hypothetical protein